MDNLISGVISIGVFAAFVVGLAISIGVVPFGIIVAIVLVLVLVSSFESIKKGLLEEKNRNNGSR